MSDIDIDTGYIEDELNNLADLITNGLGLFVTKDVLIDGSERIVLHNKPTVGASDVLYYIGANGLVVSTDGGSTWNAGFNPDGSAYFNALSANIIRALQIYGSFLRFGDINSNYIDVAPYSDNNNNPLGVSFDGSGNIRFQPQTAFEIHNQDSNGNDYNYLRVTRVSNMNIFSITNYDESHNRANDLFLNSSSSSSFFSVGNYAQLSGGEATTNSMRLESTSTESSFKLKNFSYTGTYANGNAITMTVDSNGKKLLLENYNASSANIGSRLTMESVSGGGQITLQAYNTSGQPKSYLTVKSGDMTIYSDSAIRMYSNSGQDIQLSCADDILLQASDKVECTCPNGFWVNGSRIA